MEAALSSDLHNIRYITADGKRIASVYWRRDVSQEEAIANASLLAKSKAMMEALKEVSEIANGIQTGDGKLIVQKVFSAIGFLPEEKNGLLGTEGNFGFRVVRKGHHFGLEDRLIWDKEEPGVEFFMLKNSKGVPFGGRGWYISRYYYTTLKFSKVSKEGICLDGGMANIASLSGAMMERVMAAVDAEISTFASEIDVQAWRDSWKIPR